MTTNRRILTIKKSRLTFEILFINTPPDLMDSISLLFSFLQSLSFNKRKRTKKAQSILTSFVLNSLFLFVSCTRSFIHPSLATRLCMAYHWTVFVPYFKRGDSPPLNLLFIRHILYNKFETIKDVSHEFSL